MRRPSWGALSNFLRVIFFVYLGIASLLALLFIWIGYPVAIWALAKVAADPIRPDYSRSLRRTVSVVLATREAADAIAARVENLFDTEHPADLLQVVVALDAEGARATAAELAELDSRVLVVRGDQPGGKACALNAGVRAATGEVLVMADTAQLFDRRTIPELVAHLEDDRFGAVSGALELGSSGGTSPVDLYWRLEKWLRQNESKLHSSIGVTGAVYATRRSTWPVLPPGVLLDDVFVPMSLVLSGLRIGFTLHARARDSRVFSTMAESKRKERTQTGVLQLLQLLPEIRSRKNPVRNAFVFHKLARLASPFLVVSATLSLIVLSKSALLHLPVWCRAIVGAIVFSLFALRPVRQAAHFTIRLLLSTLKAILNAANGRWQVWHK